MSIPISTGSGAASVAADAISGLQYQQIKVVGAETGSTSTLGITPDGSAKVSVVGRVSADVAGSVVAIVTGSPTVGASVIGVAPVTQVGNSSTISYIQNSVATVIIGGSVAATITPAANQSVSGAVQIAGGNSPSSVATVQRLDGLVIGSALGLVTHAVLHGETTQAGGGTFLAVKVTPSGRLITESEIEGSVVALQGGTWITSVIGVTPSSLLTGASIFGQLPAGTAPLGSVATLQGTNPWVVTNVGSIITTNVGSVITVLQAPSIVGTYAEDAAFAQNDKGFFVLGVRNDTMASVTSANLDYSQMAVGPVGENIVANAPITAWVSGTADFRSNTGGSVAVIAAQGASVFTYITGLQVVNMGSASVLVTLSGGTSSIRGYTIAPAGGGSNIVYTNGLKTNQNSAFSASISGISSVLVSAQGFTART